SRGWRVTGIDTSDEGLRQARQAATARGLQVDALHADLESWDYGANQWDLVVLVYSGCDAQLVASVRRSLRRGGVVVFEGFHVGSAPAIGWTTAALSSLFQDGFEVLHNEIAEDVSDWGIERGVRLKLVRFAARKL